MIEVTSAATDLTSPPSPLDVIVQSLDPHTRIDQLEAAMLAEGSVIDLPLVHRFTHGLYIREIFMPAGTLATSKVHKTEHPYVILHGAVSVLIPGVGVEHLHAGHIGITQPGTRRVLYMHEDTVWVTFHPNPDDESDLKVIEQRLIEQRPVMADGRTAFEHYAELLAALAPSVESLIESPIEPQLDYGGAP